MRPDIKMTQNIEIFQAIVREAMAQNPECGITLINVQQIGNNEIPGNGNEQKVLEIPTEALSVQAPVEKLMLPEKRTFDKTMPPDWLVDDVEKLLDGIETARYNTILKAILIVARRKNYKNAKAAEWLGVKHNTFYNWAHKLGITRKAKLNINET